MKTEALLALFSLLRRMIKTKPDDTDEQRALRSEITQSKVMAYPDVRAEAHRLMTEAALATPGRSYAESRSPIGEADAPPADATPQPTADNPRTVSEEKAAEEPASPP